MAAPVETVTTTADDGSGSLRQAVADVDDGGTVEFAGDVFGEIALTSGEIPIGKALTIDGPGARVLDVSGSDSSRIFNIDTAGDVAISGLTLRDGFADDGSPNFAAGGALLKRGAGALALTDMQLLDNTVTGSAPAGGALAAPSASLSSEGELVLERVTVAGNQAQASAGGARGGGLFVQARAATLRNVTIADNHVTGVGRGGGALLEDSFESVAFRLVNVTVAGNSAASRGGGLFVEDLSVGSGGNELVNSVVADNTAPSGPDCDVVAEVALVGVALIEDASDCDTSGAGTLITGQDPQLGALAWNAPGETMTMALAAGSPAIDAGGACPPPATDQRGIARPQGTGCDLGAYEARPAVAALDSPGHDFGDLEIGQGPSGPAQFAVSNDAGADLDLLVDAVALSGADAGQFALDTSDCDDGAPGPPLGRLAPGESCTVTARFDPTSAGQKQATLELDTSGGNLSATLEGTGEAPPAPDPPTPPDPPAPDPPAPPAPEPPARSHALERLGVASRCVSPSRSGRVRVELALRMARPAPVRLRIDRAVGSKARSTCPTRGKPRRFTGRFRTVKTYARARTRPVAAAVTRRVTLNLRLAPGLYRITARAHTPGGGLSKPKRRFVRVLG
jgi:hypothetical protein